MRKVFWCCLAAGAVVCCAFWAAAYVSQNPDSSIGRVAMVASRATSPLAAHSPSAIPIETDELIPADPVPVNDAPPIPKPGSHIPPEIAGMLTPPIIIHDEEEPLAAAPSSVAKADPKPALPSINVAGALANLMDVSESLKPRGPLTMPYCKEEAEPAPIMPYCAEDNPVPTMPPAPPEDMDKVSNAVRPEFDALAFWIGFFSGPGQMGCDAMHTVEKPPLPGAEESSEPSASKGGKQVNPLDLFSHPRRLQMPRPTESESDTMEMRPSDWKPYSLDPGPF